MPSDTALATRIEIAHILFLDVVGYSRLRMGQQRAHLAELQEIVRGTRAFGRADAAGELIRLPTGDGLALVFFRDPAAPVRCAVEIAKVLRGRPHLRLRMGIHSGPVYRVLDINANLNVSGSGINIAQRVMDCGDAGHILLSNSTRELLGQVGDWPLHDLGECEVKHGLRVRLFNLHSDEAGNAALPAGLRRVPGTAGSSQASSAAPRKRVAMAYRRGIPADEAVLTFLERELAARGYHVFIDRHLAVGEEWAREIAEQMRTADAVIPLLSAASVESEMLVYEVEMAHEAAQRQGGRPRILPVRVGATGSLPDPLASILNPLQYGLWQSAADSPVLLERLLEALEAPAVRRPPASVSLEPVGGAVPLDSRFYIVRPTDEEFQEAIARRDSIVLIKGARQMGKTSLLARGLQRARESGARVVLTDLQKLNAEQLESAGALFLALAECLADQLDLDALPQDTWNARRGANANFERYLRLQVLPDHPAPLVWGLDEVDRLFVCPFAGEVFGLFRAWHNERALNPAGPWSHLTLAIAYATEAHLFITDMNQSPFNVGTRLTLHDFALAQVADLNERYGAPLRGEAEEARLYRLLGGQPYLTRRALHEMAHRGLDVASLESQADGEEGIFGDHLRRILVLLARDPDLGSAVRGALSGSKTPDPESFYRLRSAGVVVGDSPHAVRLRCQLYARYLERHLL